MPGWPELAFCTPSIASVRMVLIESWSSEFWSAISCLLFFYPQRNMKRHEGLESTLRASSCDFVDRHCHLIDVFAFCNCLRLIGDEHRKHPFGKKRRIDERLHDVFAGLMK